MNELFVTDIVLEIRKPTIAANDPLRYQSQSSKDNGIAAELRAAIPQEMHSIMHTVAFQRVVSGMLSLTLQTIHFRSFF